MHWLSSFFSWALDVVVSSFWWVMHHQPSFPWSLILALWSLALLFGAFFDFSRASDLTLRSSGEAFDRARKLEMLTGVLLGVLLGSHAYAAIACAFSSWYPLTSLLLGDLLFVAFIVVVLAAALFRMLIEPKTYYDEY